MPTAFRGNPNVQFDPLWNLYIGSKAFANSMQLRDIMTINLYIHSDRLNAAEQSFLSASPTVVINVPSEYGWDPKCAVSKHITPDNFFTENKGFISSTKSVVNNPIMAVSAANPKTISQLVTQGSVANKMSPQDCLGAISMSNATRSVNVDAPKSMGARAFASCMRLASVQLSDDNTWNKVLSDGCFKECRALSAISTATNTNANMAGGVPILAPSGTIATTATGITSKIVTGAGTAFMTSVFPGYVICTICTAATTVIGTVASVESDTSLTLLNAAKLTYAGAWGINNEAMIPVHATTIGKDALRGTNIQAISIETHQMLALAASPSKLVNIGSNFCTDCAKLTRIYFNVKQNEGFFGSIVVPVNTTIVTGSHDGWTSAISQTQLGLLFKAGVSNLTTSVKFKYTVDLNTRYATITGLAYHHNPVFITNMVVPAYIIHADGRVYEVTAISYPGLDQTDAIKGSIVTYGAFSKSNPAFTDGGCVSGSLTLPATLREISSFSFVNQQKLTNNLNIICPKLAYIGVSAFENAYNNDYNHKALRINSATGLVIDKKAFKFTNFDNIIVN